MRTYRGGNSRRPLLDEIAEYDEVADVSAAQMRAAAAHATDRGLLGFLERERTESRQPPRMWTREDHAETLAKLARDFGPETARLAEQFASSSVPTPRPADREARKLAAAGRYGFR